MKLAPRQITALAISVLVLGASAVMLAALRGGVPCTPEKRECSNGTTVGRTGPMCSFAECPQSIAQGAWQSATDPESGATFRYPEKLETPYLHTNEWPPRVTVANILQCAGDTHVVMGRSYCVVVTRGAAAGSIYPHYAYTFPLDGRVVTIAFTLQLPQCANYDEAHRAECEASRGEDELDSIVDRIAQTVQLPPPPAPKETQKQGVRGTVMAGPTCPVERMPPDPACAPQPLAASLSVLSPDGKKVVATFKASDDGTFSVGLPPGTYVIRSAIEQSLPYCVSTGTFTVRAGSFTDAPVSCDTGIR